MANNSAGRNGTFDAYEKPPEPLRLIYKKYQKSSMKDLENDFDLVDFSRPLDTQRMKGLHEVRSIDTCFLQSRAFGSDITPRTGDSTPNFIKAYEI
jgi:hypothetical protein